MPKVMAPPVSDGRRRGRRVSMSLSEINVIPLVDVMLVLLIIFMVAAPMLQKGVEVNLPVTRRADKMTDARTYVTVPLSYRQNHRVFLGDESISVEVLAERVRQLMEGRDKHDIYLRGDGAVQLQDLMDVFGRLKAGGIERIGVVALERREQ